MADDGLGPGTDDEFDRQLRALTEGSAGQARFRELSAADRAKAGARRAKEARKQAARNARRAGRASRQAAGQPSAVRRWLMGSLIIAVAVAIVSGLAWLSLGRTLRGGPGDTQPPRGGTVSAGTPSATPASTASAAPAVGGPPADPFAGRPAENWADGAAGIVIPAAHAVTGYTAAQVAAAYQTTRTLLIAGYLDRPTLLGGAPTAFADLLTASQRRWFVANLDKTGRDSHGDVVSTRGVITSFARGTTLIGSVIKVSGTMSARPGHANGRTALVIEVNYRLVYPVEPPSAPADWMRIVTQLHGSTDFGYWDPAVPGLLPWEMFEASQAGARCDTSDGYVHPQYMNGPPDKIQPSGVPQDPYAQGAAAPSSGCGAVTPT